MTERVENIGFDSSLRKNMDIMTERVKIFQSPYANLFKVCHRPACENYQIFQTPEIMEKKCLKPPKKICLYIQVYNQV